MATVPETKYAKSGDVSIAYQVVGSGPFDLVVVPGWISHLDLHWENPFLAAWTNRLASFARVILFDKRGTGLSDRDVGESTLEDRMDDFRAVLDAAGSQRAAILAISEGGPLAMLFSATYPERVRALVLASSWARQAAAPDYPEGNAAATLEEWIRIVDGAWGEGETLRLFAPSYADEAPYRRFMGRFERASVSPSAARTHLSWIFDVDVRAIARTLQVPTLVLHREGDRTVPVASGRWLAKNVPNARYFEQPGDDHLPWLGPVDELLDEVQQFLTGSHDEVESDRVLATVLFADIVGSTSLVRELGDRVWHEVLDQYHALVREQLAFFRGEEIDSAGDGVFAVFDGTVRAIRCGLSICERVRTLGIETRVGVHVGECTRRGGKTSGIAVHTAARVLAAASPGEVLVSSTTKDLVAGSGIEFRDRGVHALKGIEGEWRLFAAE